MVTKIMLKLLIQSSIFASLLKKIGKGCRILRHQVNTIYKDSQTYKLFKGIWERIKIAFKYSFLGKFSEIKKEDNTTFVLENSKFVKYLLTFYKRGKYRMLNYLEESTVIKSIKKLRNGLYSMSLKTGSIIIITIILSNIFFSMLIKKEIRLIGGVVRLLFLSIGFIGLFSDINWREIKKNSFIIRYINNSYKIKN